jgi:hypothetical protein
LIRSLYESDGGIAVIRQERRKRAKAFRTESFIRNLACFSMDTLVGNLLRPLPDLRVDISKIREGTQRPEVLPEVTDPAFSTLPFSQRAALLQASRIKIQLTGKCQESRVETNDPAVVFRHCCD